jgi:hypothetical protein
MQLHIQAHILVIVSVTIHCQWLFLVFLKFYLPLFSYNENLIALTIDIFVYVLIFLYLKISSNLLHLYYYKNKPSEKPFKICKYYVSILLSTVLFFSLLMRICYLLGTKLDLFQIVFNFALLPIHIDLIIFEYFGY